MRALIAIPLSVVFVACGSSPPKEPATAAQAPEKSAEAKSEDPPPEPKQEADAPAKIPTDCASKTDICSMPKAFVDRLCANTYPNVALVLFAGSTPWTHGYLTRKTEAWNAEGGASVGGFVEFDEEVLLLTSHAPPKGGMQVSGAGGYQALRWDGSCVTLSSEEVTLKRPPSPKHPRIEWRFIEDGMREALRKDPAVDQAAVAVKRECKGVSVGDVSKKCVDADNKLVDSIVKYVASASGLPEPEKLP
ncbi:MAG TPA: hypothetical protein VHC69_35385 [Polyangiaceae bacterium]|nr:hypothetical protein [Polyangiaceae bacterium]